MLLDVFGPVPWASAQLASNVRAADVGWRDEVLQHGAEGWDEGVITKAKTCHVGLPAAGDRACVILMDDVRRPPVEEAAAFGIGGSLEKLAVLA